ncbi:MAG TPA: potassium-transporting ATPase subunit KdpA [Pseudonocardiaceae bacterium]|jgi:K+-transporting ATPase ATPase A chain|nr:potassium-transporting ATPase subunit KdpA [Pseudonocardiaceae bacterium]
MSSATWAGLGQVGLLLAALAIVYRPFGDYLARVFTSPTHWRVEKLIYRIVRVDPESDQRWPTYATATVAFALVGSLFLYALQRLQPVLPLAFGHAAVAPATAFNTAVSFITNTNWQSYAPEQTLGAGIQMAGLTVKNFTSAAMGIIVAIALIRGFTRTHTDRIGNMWVDLVRCTVRVLLPVAFVFAIVLVGLGVVQSMHSGVTVTSLDGARHTITLYPAASQEAIKELGTNGGGVYNANSAHPFENPNAWSNLIEIFLLLVIPVSLTRTLGTLVGNRRQGYTILSVMAVLWGAMLAVIWWAESHPTGIAARLAGGGMEGKETRFGIAASALFANSTTSTSTGAVNAAHDSLSGLGGGGALTNMMLGEISPGGAGTGIYGILVFAIIAVFLAGLMVGRTPEYLGKKLGRREVTFASISILIMPVLVLLGAGLAIALPATRTAMANSGAHGFSEVLYAFTSAANNNGSAFAGITVTNNFFESTLGIVMLLGRFVPILAALALAGALAQQRKVPESVGTLPTTGPLFATMLGGTIVLVAAIVFVPALALGPIAEALS